MVGGKTVISEEVFADLVKTAMAKVGNVAVSTVEESTLVAIAKRVAERVVPQINVKKADAVSADGEAAAVGHVSFEVKVSIIYGANIPDTVVKLREAVVEEVEALTGYQVDKVDVVVEKLIKPEDKAEAKEE